MNPPSETQQALIGAMLKAEREGVGLSQAEMARRVGVNKATLSRFENGHRAVSAEVRARITRVIADEIGAKRAAA